MPEGMRFAFVFCCFFCPFESDAKLVSEGYANLEKEWLSGSLKALSFSLAPIMNKAGRF